MRELVFILLNLAVTSPLFAAFAFVYWEGGFSSKCAKIAGIIFAVFCLAVPFFTDQNSYGEILIAVVGVFVVSVIINAPLFIALRSYLMKMEKPKIFWAGLLLGWVAVQWVATFFVKAWSASSI